MRIYANVKSIGKRKPVLALQPFDIEAVETLRELITQIVKQNVKSFNEEKPFTRYLLEEDIEVAHKQGKVGFHHRYNDAKQSESAAIDEALLAFKDGIYKVLHDDLELTTLDEPLTINEEDIFTFIKLTMLSGRLW
ncbi:hypothetical protein I6G82_08630 [Lysinibacillus macroides]|uniref:Uncharacterized protein n=1 Tax=Lysinibacillus macroides TaxID=33935 RepID=A0A0M9DJM1_9BACI|nr:hypothetical protein [Lysinibacillus macroides]KOY81532.1 hypothetical protein ADM90_14065 [Lysinibacillus macroides]QPR69633.1 hypothetical protein I6G82_08630 [Lysinibacillus macroides]